MCPFTTMLGLGGAGPFASGAFHLLAGRPRLAMAATLAGTLLGMGWAAYFLVLRAPGMRVALEAATVLGALSFAVALRRGTRSSRFASLEQLAASSRPAACPLGFGDARGARRAGADL